MLRMLTLTQKRVAMHKCCDVKMLYIIWPKVHLWLFWLISRLLLLVREVLSVKLLKTQYCLHQAHLLNGWVLHLLQDLFVIVRHTCLTDSKLGICTDYFNIKRREVLRYTSSFNNDFDVPPSPHPFFKNLGSIWHVLASKIRWSEIFPSRIIFF